MIDREFLVAVAQALETAVTNGLDIARRIDLDKDRPWQFGGLNRVYYDKRDNHHYDPDEFNPGIAPSVKLLHAFVARLVEIDANSAAEFADRWKNTTSPVWLRLWAALSRDARVTSAREVSDMLLSLDARCFWDIYDFPEIAELRAFRFQEFDTDEQGETTSRIRRLPPRSLWLRKANADDVKRERLYWAVRELRRIEVAGGTLPETDKKWLNARIDEFPDLAQMNRSDMGFSVSSEGQLVLPNPDYQYDLLTGEERLRALNSALPDDQRYGRSPAEDWICEGRNTVSLLSDFESVADGGDAYGRVWGRFGWAHRPTESTAQHEQEDECSRVLSMLARLSEATLRDAINGVAAWFDAWKEQLVILPQGLTVWSKIWPVAAAATNSLHGGVAFLDHNLLTESSSEPRDRDTFNTPSGKLVGVFLQACPSLNEIDRPFDANNVLRRMRDELVTATGRAGLIARYRMFEGLPYFLTG